MSTSPFYLHVEAALIPILEELAAREPIFHTRRFGEGLEDFERGTAPEFWEVGASGRRYSRGFILGMCSRKELADADAEGWKATGFGLKRLGQDCYLLTYTLDQKGRLTRRATIWEKAETGWRIVYHQGTVVTAEGDDVLPS